MYRSIKCAVDHHFYSQELYIIPPLSSLPEWQFSKSKHTILNLISFRIFVSKQCQFQPRYLISRRGQTFGKLYSLRMVKRSFLHERFLCSIDTIHITQFYMEISETIPYSITKHSNTSTRFQLARSFRRPPPSLSQPHAPLKTSQCQFQPRCLISRRGQTFGKLYSLRMVKRFLCSLETMCVSLIDQKFSLLWRIFSRND